mgnify:CR=1 FL=1
MPLQRDEEDFSLGDIVFPTVVGEVAAQLLEHRPFLVICGEVLEEVELGNLEGGDFGAAWHGEEKTARGDLHQAQPGDFLQMTARGDDNDGAFLGGFDDIDPFVGSCKGGLRLDALDDGLAAVGVYAFEEAEDANRQSDGDRTARFRIFFGRPEDMIFFCIAIR